MASETEIAARRDYLARNGGIPGLDDPAETAEHGGSLGGEAVGWPSRARSSAG